MVKMITFGSRSVPVFFTDSRQDNGLDRLQDKLRAMAYDLDFRRRWRRIKSVELVHDVAIFQYNDGTKLYLEVS